jgi:hypothetical protein
LYVVGVTEDIPMRDYWYLMRLLMTAGLAWAEADAIAREFGR